ncbi:ATP-grasp domain-containing protein [Bosea eneae]|uniref:ATP-grasp domain-containing protein n=1 Tax=Bosea eneae TaxID=151454 RepID=A0ABW0INR3_9HYPH
MTGRAILLADRFRMEYRILKAVSLYFNDIHIIGTGDGAWLKHSRHCRAFHELGKPFALAGPGEADAIDHYAKEHQIACILPTCGHTTRFLASYSERFETPCFPIPATDAFDRLNNKLTFHQLCLDLDLPTPDTRIFETWSELRAAASTGALSYPFIVKPPSLDGSWGVRRINGPEDLCGQVDYSPILAQYFIPGRDLCVFYLCERGNIVGQVAYTFARYGIRFVQRPRVDAFSRAIAAHLALDGVIGFDLRERADGQVFFIESNPRFWFRMDVAALAGLDFIRAALTKEPLRQGPPDGLELRNRGRLLKAAVLPWRLNWLERRVIREFARDPLLPFLELLGKTRSAGPVVPKDRTIVTIPANVTPY